MDDALAARRAQLTGYIADSRRLARRLIVLAPIGIAAAVLVRILAPGWAWLVVVSTVAFYGVGRYITWVHIADWKMLLRDLDAGPPKEISGHEGDG